MKSKLSALLAVVLLISMFAGCTSAPAENTPASNPPADTAASETPAPAAEASTPESNTKIAWYLPAPHPYWDEAQVGIDQFIAEQGMDVIVQIGPDWTQASENEKVEALVAQGVNALIIYPCDASGANGLYEEIKARGVNIVNFATDTDRPNASDFAVATDVKQAAIDSCEALIQMMGEKGNILNVLEVLEDPNTVLRRSAIEETVAKYPDVNIIQEIAGIQNQEEAVIKIESALSANAGKVDGMIATGFVATVGMVQTLSDYYEKQGKDKTIYSIGMDTDPTVLKAIDDGILNATISQNPVGQTYISCMILKLMGEGYKVKGDYFVNSGNVTVTKDNLTTYQNDINEVTKSILDRLTTDYLTK